MMSSGPIAGFIAAYLYKFEEVAAHWQLDGETSIRNTFPKGYSTTNSIIEEIARCKEALAQIQLCFSVLFHALNEDSKNPKRKNFMDKARRIEFSDWVIEQSSCLNNLISNLSENVRNADSVSNENDKNIYDISVLSETSPEIREKIVKHGSIRFA